MFSDKITFSEFEILTRPELFEQIKSDLKKSSVKSRPSFSAILDHLLDDYRKEFFEKLHQRYELYSCFNDMKEVQSLKEA